MENVRVVIVEPRYQINLGYIARAAKNFGVQRLFLVNPRCKIGKDAVKYSKHAHELLKNAKLCGSIKEATKGTSAVIGTTGLSFKASEGMYNLFSSKQLPKLLKNSKSISLLIGRDDTGLSKRELADCDAVVVVPSSKEYPVLNISHALAIMLYELRTANAESGVGYEVPAPERKRLIRLFAMNVNKMRSVKDKKGVIRVFQHVINRASPSTKELRALAAALSLNKKEK